MRALLFGLFTLLSSAAYADLDLSIHKITGLSDMHIDKIELNGQSTLNKLSIDLEISIPTIYAYLQDARAQIHCGIIHVGPNVSGHIRANSATGTATATLELIEWEDGKLEIAHFNVDELSLHYSSVVPVLGASGLGPLDPAATLVVELLSGIAANAFKGEISHQLANVLKPVLSDIVNDLIHDSLAENE